MLVLQGAYCIVACQPSERLHCACSVLERQQACLPACHCAWICAVRVMRGKLLCAGELRTRQTDVPRWLCAGAEHPDQDQQGHGGDCGDVALITQGEKVGGSEATLLAKLGIKPFSYGLVIQQARSPLSWVPSCGRLAAADLSWCCGSACTTARVPSVQAHMLESRLAMRVQMPIGLHISQVLDGGSTGLPQCQVAADIDADLMRCNTRQVPEGDAAADFTGLCQHGHVREELLNLHKPAHLAERRLPARRCSRAARCTTPRCWTSRRTT